MALTHNLLSLHARRSHIYDDDDDNLLVERACTILHTLFAACTVLLLLGKGKKIYIRSEYTYYTVQTA